MRTKALGIVGGLGPLAGIDCMKKILDATKASSDQDHIPIVQISFPHTVADRTAFLSGQDVPNPGEAIGYIMQTLAKAGASVIAMPCNTAHSPRILDKALSILREKHSDVVFVHIIEALIEELTNKHPQVKKVGVLSTKGTFDTGLYEDALKAANCTPMAPSDEGRQRVQEAISHPEFGVKACSNNISEKAKELLRAEAIAMIDQGAEAIVLGCTEIPLALTKSSLTHNGKEIPLLDATLILARKALATFAPEKLKAL